MDTTSSPATPKPLMRDMKNGMWMGVCAGISKQLRIDVSIVRLLFVLLSVFGAFGTVAYIIFGVVVKEEPLTPAEAQQYGLRRTMFWLFTIIHILIIAIPVGISIFMLPFMIIGNMM